VNVAIRVPPNATLLDAWDDARAQHPLDRALTLLRAFTGRSRRGLAELSIGERDELLRETRRRVFGDRLEAVCACEHCGEANEFDVDAALLPHSHGREAVPVVSVARDGDGNTVTARLPNSLDLAAVAALEDEEAARALAARCLLSGEAELDQRTAERLDATLSEAQPIAALDITFACSVCGEPNAVPFDAATFLWNDVAEVCRRLILDVDALASAYSWSESEILALSAQRRAAYVQLGRR
jgi:hypothetical protein